METKIQFQKDASVLSASGKKVGSLERIVLHPASKVVTDIVVSIGVLFDKEERVVPIDLVAETTENQIVLRSDAGELESFPLFEERHIVDTMDGTDPPLDAIPPLMYGYGAGITPALIPTSGEQFITTLDPNIPEGTVALKEGAKVISADGKHVGHVERVVANSAVDQITHILISTGMLLKEKKFSPIKWVMVVGEDEIHLRVNKEFVEGIAETSPSA